MLDCKHATHLISQSQDVRLSWRQRIGLQFHLMLCDACTQFSRQIEFLRQAVRQAGRRIENDEGVKLSQRAHLRIAEAMEAQKQSIAIARQNPDQHFTD
jgi:hypothetical protein